MLLVEIDTIFKATGMPNIYTAENKGFIKKRLNYNALKTVIDLINIAIALLFNMQSFRRVGFDGGAAESFISHRFSQGSRGR